MESIDGNKSNFFEGNDENKEILIIIILMKQRLKKLI